VLLGSVCAGFVCIYYENAGCQISENLFLPAHHRLPLRIGLFPNITTLYLLLAGGFASQERKMENNFKGKSNMPRNIPRHPVVVRRERRRGIDYSL
jgi:hypothetical protein